MAQCHIGTSGWSYEDWIERFYPRGIKKTQWLEFYTHSFDTVELNASFYRQPRDAVVDNWAAATPPNFVFAVKMSRLITHIKRFVDVEEPLVRFNEMAGHFGPKLGAVLIQLPPSMRLNPERDTAFFSLLRRLAPGQRYALEGRHFTWFSEEAYALLRRFSIAHCIPDSGGRYPTGEAVTAPFTYLRFHGPTTLYSSGYDTEHLTRVAEQIQGQLRAGLDVYVYFNNDFHGHAINNARELIQLVHTPPEILHLSA